MFCIMPQHLIAGPSGMYLPSIGIETSQYRPVRPRVRSCSAGIKMRGIYWGNIGIIDAKGLQETTAADRDMYLGRPPCVANVIT